jgi:hypothetical protein
VRHLRSILYALVLAPAVWILCGVGFDQDLTGRARDNGGIESLFGVLLLVLAGAAYAILLFSPISPLGPLLAGLVFAGAGAWARISPDSYAGVWPANVAKDGFDVSMPGYGLAVLLAVPLLATALNARRWRAFQPPEIVLFGTIGQAHGAAPVAGTPMASERTTVIPHQRHEPAFVPGFGGPPADTTQVVGPGQPTVTLPVDDGDEKTTVMHLGRRASRAQEPTQVVAAPRAEEPTQVAPAAEVAEADDSRTEDLAATDETTSDISADRPTEDVAGDGDFDGDGTTRVVLPAAGDDGDEKTQLIRLPKADSGEQTQVIRSGTVQPPTDRTELLTLPVPEEPDTVVAPVADQSDTTAVSIVGAERPDPGEDPTTRLIPPGRQPGAPATRPDPERRAATVTSLERPADEAADDTRALTLPAQRPPAEEEPTRHL